MKKLLLVLFIIIVCINIVTSCFGITDAWSNGGYSSNPTQPVYGTHDWIAQHALDWLPANEKQFLVDNLAAYLYGTELPDNNNAVAPGHIGDTSKHHIYYRANGVLQEDDAAVRASEEYQNALSRLNAGNFSGAAINAGIMSHYIADVAVFAHVMGANTDWGAETDNIHSNYESYVDTRTDAYSDTYNSYLSFDGFLSTVSAYDAAKNLAYDTTFDSGGTYTCVWMNNNYNTSNPNSPYWIRAGESLNLAVNAVADVLHTLFISSNAEETSTSTPTPSPTTTISPTASPTLTPTPTSIPSANLELSCSSSVSYDSFRVEITGRITENNNGLASQPIAISYSVTNGKTWQDLTSVNTNSGGSFSAVWTPSVTGNYMIKASWVLDDSVTEIVNLAVLPFTDSTSKNIFSVASNSTISDLAFNSTNNQLSFTVSGATETSGYTDVTVAKTLVQDITQVKVFIDGVQVQSSTTETSDSWILHFTYQHSTHQVTLQLDAASNTSTSESQYAIYVIIGATTVVLIIATILVLRKRSKKS